MHNIGLQVCTRNSPQQQTYFDISNTFELRKLQWFSKLVWGHSARRNRDIYASSPLVKKPNLTYGRTVHHCRNFGVTELRTWLSMPHFSASEERMRDHVRGVGNWDPIKGSLIPYIPYPFIPTGKPLLKKSHVF